MTKLPKDVEKRFDKKFGYLFESRTYGSVNREVKSHIAQELLIEGKKRYKEAEKTTTTVLEAKHKAELHLQKEGLKKEIKKWVRERNVVVMSGSSPKSNIILEYLKELKKL